MLTVGRPKTVQILKNDIDYYRGFLKLKWVDIAIIYNVNINTIKRWRKETYYLDPIVKLSDPQVIDSAVEEYVQNNPRRGIRDVKFYLNDNNVRVSHDAVMQSLRRIDPISVEARTTARVPRRKYDVIHPNHLWHHDGHCKLNKIVGIYTHGIIDGASRLIVCLKSHNNNKATTLLEDFVNANKQYSIPFRVRGDKGGENMKVAEFMFSARPPIPGDLFKPYLVGSSNHNQRIERLWRDVMQSVIKYYLEFFQQLLHDLDQVSFTDVQKSVIQHLFLPRVNEDLERFVGMWNNHTMASLNNRTPLQYYEINKDILPPPDADIDPETYGREEFDDEEVDELMQALEPIDKIDIPLDLEILEHFKDSFPPLNLEDGTNYEVISEYVTEAFRICEQLIEIESDESI